MGDLVSTAAWDDVVTSALLGTDRRMLDPGLLPGEVGRLGAELPASDAPGRLLGAAALWTVAARAGSALASPAVAPPEPSPPETGRVAGPAARARLDGLLSRADGEGATLLTHWLRAAAERGLVAPPACLPGLLELARTQRRYADGVRAVLGARGRWLAAQRADWADALGETPEAPSDQTRETAADRARRLRASATQDEATLEAALADRSVEVRTVAVDLLGRLPDSAFTRDVVLRAAPALRIERQRLRRTLVVTLPDADVPVRKPDPFPATPTGTGRGAWLLQNLIGATPLDHWERATGTTPQDLVDLPVADDLHPAVRAGWLQAAARQGNRPWARALLAASPFDRFLLDVLPEDERVHRLLAALRASDHASLTTAFDLAVAIVPAPWPTSLVDAALTAISTGEPWKTWYATQVHGQLAAVLPDDERTEAAVRAAALRRFDSDPWHSALQRTADLLFTRRQMLEELR